MTKEQRSTERLRRVLRLARLVQTHRKAWTCDESQAALRVSRRTLFRDLALAREAGFEIRYSRVYHRFEPDFVLPSLVSELTLRDGAALLLFLTERRAPLRGSRYEEALNGAVGKLSNMVLGEGQSWAHLVRSTISEFREQTLSPTGPGPRRPDNLAPASPRR